MFFGGAVVGLITGFLVGYMPEQVSLTTAKISRKHRLRAALFAVFGYLVWLGLGIAFWWVCLKFQESVETERRMALAVRTACHDKTATELQVV